MTVRMMWKCVKHEEGDDDRVTTVMVATTAMAMIVRMSKTMVIFASL